MELNEIKQFAEKKIRDQSDSLRVIGHRIWENPEIRFKEFHAHELLTTYFKEQGFIVTCSYVLETGFVATFGSGRPNIVIICEYDALPEIGHACGHNLIAECGVASALGLKAAIEKMGIGKLTVLGTPAEEGGGGKIDFIRAGAFEEVDCALMAHPWPCDITPNPVFIARKIIDVQYTGVSSHAAGFPWNGVNALDAAVLAYSNISCMRQQLKPSWRIHGIITNGGERPNIIPEKSSLSYYLRAPNMSELEELENKALACFKAAALSTGCQINIIHDEKTLYNLINNDVMCAIFTENVKKLGLPLNPNTDEGGASTDMANVSHVIPSIHPLYNIGVNDCLNHTREFTKHADSEVAHKNTLDVAVSLAFTGIDIIYDKKLLPKILQQFKEDTKRK